MQCWAVGISIDNINSNGTTSPLAETWNGVTWSLGATPPLPAGSGGGLFALSCVTGSDCWAVGAVNAPGGNGGPDGTLVEHWDGTSWSVVPSPTPVGPGVAGAFLQGVSCTSSSNCVAVGFATDQNGENLNALIEQWNGAAWNIVPGAVTGQPFDQLSTVQCLDADDCWAVGNAGPNQQNPNFLPNFPGAVGDQGLIEHWDGASWSVVPSATIPSPSGGFLYGLACAAPADCWASGATTDGVNGRASGILMEHWDGSAWTDTSASMPNPAPADILSSISCLGAAQCWAVGSVGPFGGNGGDNFQPQAFIENWNGTSWSVDPSPNASARSASWTRSRVCAPSGAWRPGPRPRRPSRTTRGCAPSSSR